MILRGDARSLPLAAGIVQCVVTSPPYWGLRDYGVPGQLGLESTPDEYVQNMVTVFREVWRVLRDDGTLWLNLGDSYARTGGWASNDGLDGCARGESGRAKTNIQNGRNGQKRPDGLKEKDLVGIPWRVAFALQADGWYLRQDIIWAKPNPMPESVRDRCTKAHEYVFLLTKRQRYYYDAEAIAEGASGRSCGNLPGGKSGSPRDGLEIRNFSGVSDKEYFTRNRRSVWTVNTQPYPEAHFATFPEKLVEPCILSGSKPGDLVMDPFAGSGTVGAVCRRFARRFVGVELNPAYVGLAQERLKGQVGLALEASP